MKKIMGSIITFVVFVFGGLMTYLGGIGLRLVWDGFVDTQLLILNLAAAFIAWAVYCLDRWFESLPDRKPLEYQSQGAAGFNASLQLSRMASGAHIVKGERVVMGLDGKLYPELPEYGEVYWIAYTDSKDGSVIVELPSKTWEPEIGAI